MSYNMQALAKAHTYEQINGVSCEPLLQEVEQKSQTSFRKEPVISIFGLGACIGCLAQLASLGGSFVMASAFGSEINEDNITIGARLTAFGVAGLISTAFVAACSIVRYFYDPSLEQADGPTCGRGDFCFVTGIVLGGYVSCAVTKAMIDADLSSFVGHAAVAVIWSTVCLMIVPRASTDNSETIESEEV